MIIVNEKNTAGDIQRLVWYRIPIIAAFALGYLLQSFLNGSEGNLKTDIQSTGDYSSYLSAAYQSGMVNVYQSGMIIPKAGS